MLFFEPTKLWELPEVFSLLDVRSPGEFEIGHIPGASNLPLFTDEQRSQVGTLYKQVSTDVALKRGLEFAGEQMRWYVEEAERLCPGKKAAIHCWRGGQRSRSMAWLLELAGMEVAVLEGGYKAYRRFQRTYYERFPSHLIILGGPTGSGKTEILHQLKAMGEQIVDLEGIACHKGSAFGAFGQPAQPKQQQFENNLFDSYRTLNHRQRIWVENESRSIGCNGIPDGFWNQMEAGTFFQLEPPLDERVKRLVSEYGQVDPDALKETFYQIQKRLGGQHVKRAIEAIDAGALDIAAKVALSYYDKAYCRSTERMPFSGRFHLKGSTQDVHQVANELITIADRNGI